MLQTQIERIGGTGWVDWGGNLIGCYPISDEIPDETGWYCTTDHDYVMKMTTGQLRLKLDVSCINKMNVYILVLNQESEWIFRPNYISFDHKQFVCDIYRFVKDDSEGDGSSYLNLFSNYVSPLDSSWISLPYYVEDSNYRFEIKHTPCENLQAEAIEIISSTEIIDIFANLDQIQSIINSNLSDLSKLLNDSLRFKQQQNLIDIYQLLDKVDISQHCQQIYQLTSKLISNQFSGINLCKCQSQNHS